jgi:hypothetical protein
MTERNQNIYDEVVFTIEAECSALPQEERATLKQLIEGERTLEDVLTQYKAEALRYGGI